MAQERGETALAHVTAREQLCVVEAEGARYRVDLSLYVTNAALAASGQGLFMHPACHDLCLDGFQHRPHGAQLRLD